MIYLQENINQAVIVLRDHVLVYFLVNFSIEINRPLPQYQRPVIN